MRAVLAAVLLGHCLVGHGHRTFEGHSSYSGCSDALSNCDTLGPALWQPDGSNAWSCKSPAHLICQRTCGQCQDHQIASAHQHAASALAAPFRPPLNWRKYITRVVEGHLKARPHLRESTTPIRSESPWVVQLEEFLSAAECELLIQIAEAMQLRPDVDMPATERNVSLNTCDMPECMLHPLVNEVYRRTASLLDVPAQNFESLEFLRYYPGQHYRPHLDCEPHELEGEVDEENIGPGMRVMTVLFYLNDVQEGGGTLFVHPNLTIAPKKGSLVLFVSSTEADITRCTPLAEHAALPVEKGVKYAATFWVHPMRFEQVNSVEDEDEEHDDHFDYEYDDHSDSEYDDHGHGPDNDAGTFVATADDL